MSLAAGWYYRKCDGDCQEDKDRYITARHGHKYIMVNAHGQPTTLAPNMRNVWRPAGPRRRFMSGGTIRSEICGCWSSRSRRLVAWLAWWRGAISALWLMLPAAAFVVTGSLARARVAFAAGAASARWRITNGRWRGSTASGPATAKPASDFWTTRIPTPKIWICSARVVVRAALHGADAQGRGVTGGLAAGPGEIVGVAGPPRSRGGAARHARSARRSGGVRRGRAGWRASGGAGAVGQPRRPVLEARGACACSPLLIPACWWPGAVLWAAAGFRDLFLVMFAVEAIFIVRFRRTVARVVEAVEQPAHDLALLAKCSPVWSGSVSPRRLLVESARRVGRRGQAPSERIWTPQPADRAIGLA